MKKLKCFLVDCGSDNGGQLYFAETRGQAKAMAANDEDTDITGIESCNRKPQYDKYAPGPVPVRVLMADGWWFECSSCSRQVFEGENYDYNADCELTPVTQGRFVWCSVECKHRNEIREADRTIEEAQRRKEAIAALTMHFPGCPVRQIHERFRSQPCITFDLPGVELDQGIGWELGSQYVAVAPIDRAHWDECEEKRLVPVKDWESEGGRCA